MTSDDASSGPARRSWTDLYLGPTPDYRDDVLRADRPHAAAARLDLPGRWLPMVEIADHPPASRGCPGGRSPRPCSSSCSSPPRRRSTSVLVGEVPGSVRRGQERADRLCRVRPGVRGEPVDGRKPQGRDRGRRDRRDRSALHPRRAAGHLRDAVHGDRYGSRDALDGQRRWLRPRPADHRATPDDLVRAVARRAVDRVRVVDRRHGIDLVRKSRRLGRRTLDLGVPVGSIAFRPPDGKQLLFTGASLSAHADEIYLVNADGTGLRPVVKAGSEVYTDAVWSADGTHVLYSWADEPLHIIAADGAGDRVLRRARPAGSAGRRSRPTARRSSSSAPTTPTGSSTSIVRADGTGSPVDITGAVLETGSRYQWSPDSTVILARPNEISSQQQLWDPTTGQAPIAPWPRRATRPGGDSRPSSGRVDAVPVDAPTRPDEIACHRLLGLPPGSGARRWTRDRTMSDIGLQVDSDRLVVDGSTGWASAHTYVTYRAARSTIRVRLQSRIGAAPWGDVRSRW